MSTTANEHARQVMTTSKSHEWYTPANIVERVRAFYGGRIDLDPATCEVAQETVKATHHYTVEDDGLRQPWHGNVWCNPPYGNDTGKFVAKALEAYSCGSVQ